MQIVQARFFFVFKILFLSVMLIASTAVEINAQVNSTDEKADTSFHYEEINVLFMVEGYGDFYADVIYTNNDSLFVNVEELFRTLKIACIAGQKGDSLGGFIERENRMYVIDYRKNQIKVGDKIINSQNRLIKEMGALYMESSLFPEAFGITLTFNYRALAIILKSNFELPVIKQQRIEKLRNNMSKVIGEIIPDTVVQRNYHFFKAGMFDWSVASSQTLNGPSNNRFVLGVGAELLFGEADVSLNYYDQQKITNRQVQYLWRWVDNDKQIIKQAQIGNISLQTLAFINSPIIGAVVRNSPTTVRKAKGYYPINAYTEPNWMVELYINNVLVDYTRADASGLYMFKVPIVYGFTTLKLKFYGPMGEERIEERSINLTYTVLPANEFEYGLSAGIVQDTSLSRFGKAELNYGVSRYLTIGGGLEYLSSITNGPFIPYAKFTVQPFSKLVLNGEYAYGVKTSGILNYYFMKNAFLEINYTKYVAGQLAIPFISLEERKVKLSVPFNFKKINGYANLNFTQLVYKDFYYNQGNVMFSVSYNRISVNSTTQLNWINQITPYISSDLAMLCRLKNEYNVRISSQYNISEGRFVTCRAEFEKRIPKGYLSVYYERNISYNDNSLTLSFKYDLPFARTNVSASYGNGHINFSESVQGSLAFGGGNKHVHVSNNSSVTKGGISLYPFLDLNNNGLFDAGEHMVKLTAVRIMGGNVIFSKKDSIVRIPDLNAFISYFVSFDDVDLPNISWRFKKKLYQILIDPNQFKRVDIPIIAVGEVMGTAYMNKEHSLKGIGRIIVKFYKKNSDKAIAETLSESDGNIDYMGLAPGEYVARIDAKQLSNLSFTADPPQREFTIRTLEDGDIVEGLDFMLTKNQ